MTGAWPRQIRSEYAARKARPDHPSRWDSPVPVFFMQSFDWPWCAGSASGPAIVLSPPPNR
jgi:hypothetical protein